MGDSDSDRGGSDVEGDDDEPGFDPAKDLENMTEKQRKKWEKSIKTWRLFMDFLFRHTAIVTFRYNCFENEDLTQFMIAMERAESLRAQSKLKKGEEPRIDSFKVMKEACDLLVKQKYLMEANRIKRFMDIAGRMRGLGTIAGGFYKALKKGKVRGIDKIKYYLDYWKGFCVRSYDYSQLSFHNADPASFNELERKFLVWPTVVKTAIHLSNRFLRRASESTGLELMSSDPKTMQQHMQAAEFVLATKIEEMLGQRVVNETKSFLLGTSVSMSQVNKKPATPDLDDQWQDLPNLQDIDPELLKPIPDHGGIPKQEEKYDLPVLEEIDPNMLRPIEDGGVMMTLPEDPPKEKKKGKKGKGKKSGKGRSSSASSHKGKKKKKK